MLTRGGMRSHGPEDRSTAVRTSAFDLFEAMHRGDVWAVETGENTPPHLRRLTGRNDLPVEGEDALDHLRTDELRLEPLPATFAQYLHPVRIG